MSRYAAPRTNEIGAAQPPGGATGKVESQKAIAKIGTAQSISAGRDDARSLRNRQTPRSRKYTWPSSAVTVRSSTPRPAAVVAESTSHRRASPARKKPHDAIQSRNAGRRNFRYRSRNTTNSSTVPAAWTRRENR